LCKLHRVSGIAKRNKMCPFDNPAILEVKAGDYPSCEHHR